MATTTASFAAVVIIAMISLRFEYVTTLLNERIVVGTAYLAAGICHLELSDLSDRTPIDLAKWSARAFLAWMLIGNGVRVLTSRRYFATHYRNQMNNQTEGS